MGARTVVRSDVGKVRDGNEDRAVVREVRGTLLMAVADGVGGNAGGEIAADAAVAALSERFFAAPRDRTLEARLADAVREANTAVLKAADTSGSPLAATTLVAAVVRADHLVVANLGDSRAYLVRDGTAHQLTEDHSGDTQHAITRFVGDPRGVQPDVFVEALRPADRVVLCSDGLTRHVTPEEIASAAAGTEPGAAVSALVELAISRGGEDNVTVVVHAARDRARLASRRALAFGIFLALVVLVVAATAAVLFSLVPSP